MGFAKMLRAAGSSVAKRALLNSSRRCAAPRTMAFHASAKRDEESKEVAPSSAAPTFDKGGLFGTGINEWFAVPVGLAAAIPIIHFDWYVINEETQLAAVFIAFCVTLYKQGGDAIYKSLDEKAQTILKEHNEAEDKVIEAMEKQLEFLQGNTHQVEHFEAINGLRMEAYDKLNAAGKIKPQHEFKAQVEKMLDMIVAEEASVAEKTKMALMAEATAAVTEKFSSTKALKKAALDSAINAIKGETDVNDPVKDAFVDFFKNKAAEAKKSDDGSEEAANRAALIAKMNSIAKNEKFFFQFDESGKAKVTV